MRSILAPALSGLLGLSTLPVQAHDGHGLFGPHWHATDVLGFVALGVFIALVWRGRK